MRIGTLRLERFGHFADAALDLGGGGLQVVYGDNEAGKTTILEAIRGLLFGFPRQTPYNFRYAYSELLVRAELEFRDSERASVTRFKRDKNAFEGALLRTGQPVDEGWLATSLGQPARALFDNVFGFSLADLERGEEALREGGVAEALYGSGVGGGADVARLRDALDAEAGELFRAQARKPKVSALLAELSALRATRDAAALRPREYAERQADVARSKEKAALAEAEVAATEGRLALLRRVAGAIPHRNDLAALRRELAQLAVPDAFPPDGAERFEKTRAERDRLRRSIATREERIERLQRELEGLDFAERLLPAAGRVRALVPETSEIRGYVRDLPKRERERERILEAVERGLAELGPDWSVDRLQGYTPDRSRDRRLAALGSERKDLDAAVQSAEASRKEAERGLARARRALESLPAPRDLQGVTELLSDREAYERRLARLEERMERAAQLDAKRDAARLRLAPPCTAPEPEGLPVPAQATLREMAAERQACERAVQRAREEVGGAEEALRRAEEALREGASPGAPSVEALEAERAHRERGWKLVRAAWLDGRDVSEESVAYDADRPLESAYEEAVRAADACADELREKADAVARREQGARAAEAARADLERARGRLEADADEAAAFEARWVALWSDCGFEPLSPDAMLAWWTDHAAYRALCQELEAEERANEELRESIGAYEARVLERLGGGREFVRGLLDKAAAEVEAEAKARLERDTLLRTIAEHEHRLAELRTEAPELERRLSQWFEHWAEFVRETGLEADADPDAARDALGALGRLKAELSKAPDLDRRIEEMRASVDRFETEARALGGEFAEDLLPLPAPDVIERLADRLRDEEGKRGAYEERRRSLEEAVEELRDERVALAATETDLAELLRLAEAESETGFLEVAERHERRTRLLAGARDEEAAYERHRSDGSVEDFDAAIAEAQGDAVGAEIVSLAGRLDDLKTRLGEANQELGAARSRFDEMDGSEEAARLEQEIEGKRAELLDAAERYAVLTLARRLLVDEMQRFERENQPELLRDASVFFANMTGGRYEAVRARLTDQALLAVTPDNHEKTPDQLSTGARQQLYLALRLAYIRHYCRTSEPLPLVMDDVLVNFDDRRAEATLRALAEMAEEHQVLFFTCHRHLVELAEKAHPSVRTTVVPAVV